MSNVAGVELELAERRLPLRELAPPSQGEAHLWLLDLARLGSPLQPDVRIDPNVIPMPQQRTVRRFYLRLLLGAYLGLPGKDVHLRQGERGKPVLDTSSHEQPLEFSLAASSGHCLVGVTTGSVIGVDLEPGHRRANKPLALARRYFSPDEHAGLVAIDDASKVDDALQEAFLHTWACKEAVVKAGGTGIANALCRFTVDVRPGEPATIIAMDDDDAAAWQLRSFRLPGDLVGAVTVRYPELSVRGFRLAPRA